jgi:hypothetical protein
MTLENLERTLIDKCNKFCELQRNILFPNSSTLNIIDKNTLISLSEFIKESLEFIDFFVKLYEKALNSTINMIKELSSMLIDDPTNKNIPKSLDTLFQIYYKVLNQILVDNTYFTEGLILIKGHLDESKKLKSIMDRKTLMATKYLNKSNTQFLKDYLRKDRDKNYSMVSIDGLCYIIEQIKTYSVTNKLGNYQDIYVLEDDTWNLQIGSASVSLQTLRNKAKSELDNICGVLRKFNILHIQRVKNQPDNYRIKIINKVNY